MSQGCRLIPHPIPPAEWWEALERVLGPEHRLDFLFVGQALQGKTRIWLYRHVDTRRHLNLDEHGQAYEYISASGATPHHFRRIPVGDAILNAFVYQAPQPTLQPS